MENFIKTLLFKSIIQIYKLLHMIIVMFPKSVLFGTPTYCTAE